jgi:hypothetical protein
MNSAAFPKIRDLYTDEQIETAQVKENPLSPAPMRRKERATGRRRSRPGAYPAVSGGSGGDSSAPLS